MAIIQGSAYTSDTLYNETTSDLFIPAGDAFQESDENDIIFLSGSTNNVIWDLSFSNSQYNNNITAYTYNPDDAYLKIDGFDPDNDYLLLYTSWSSRVKAELIDADRDGLKDDTAVGKRAIGSTNELLDDWYYVFYDLSPSELGFRRDILDPGFYKAGYGIDYILLESRYDRDIIKSMYEGTLMQDNSFTTTDRATTETTESVTPADYEYFDSDNIYTTAETSTPDAIEKDSIYGTKRKDKLRTKKNKPAEIYGLGGSDKLIGSNFNDFLYGGAGSDKINGKGGDDIIDPGKFGKNWDQVVGGKGADTFVLRDGYWAYIKDFKIVEDKLDLTGTAGSPTWGYFRGNTRIYGEELSVAQIKGKVDLSDII